MGGGVSGHPGQRALSTAAGKVGNERQLAHVPILALPEAESNAGESLKRKKSATNLDVVSS